jgi:hypothetical protein
MVLGCDVVFLEALAQWAICLSLFMKLISQVRVEWSL